AENDMHNMNENRAQDLSLTNEDMELLTDSSLQLGSRWEILLGSSDEELCYLLTELFDDDERIDVTVVTNGCDALVACSLFLPHLIIIDEDLSDISSLEVIKSIKRWNDFKDIVVLLATTTEIDKESEKELGENYFLKTDIDTTYLSRKISTHLFSSDHVSPPKRRWSRRDVDIHAKLVLTGPADSDTIIGGDAVIKNISRTGAYLSDIRFDSEIQKIETYKILLKIDQAPLADWEAESVIVNINEDNSAGLKFMKISKKNQLKISSALRH
ncbi:hypothetical protein ACFL30_01470, partial [Candidatus Latescibacterota bacterium]